MRNTTNAVQCMSEPIQEKLAQRDHRCLAIEAWQKEKIQLKANRI
jgi:hypothetical protein